MRKGLLGILALPMLLGACDRPIDRVDLVCDVRRGMYRDEYSALGVMNAKIYEDYALVKVHGKEYRLSKVINRSNDDVLSLHTMYAADKDFPAADKKLGLEMSVNKQSGFMTYTVWIGDNGVDCAVPHAYKGKYAHPMPEDICINELRSLVFRCYDIDSGKALPGMCINYLVSYSFTDCDDCFGGVLSYTIPAEDAIKLSPAWDYSAEIKAYFLRKENEELPEYAKDACDVLERVKQYIVDKGLNEVKHEKIDDMSRKEWYIENGGL